MAYSNARSFFPRDQRIRLGGKDHVTILKGARETMLNMMNESVAFPAARTVADRANAASSWGGYRVWYGGTVARVYGINARSSERGRRLLSIVGQL